MPNLGAVNSSSSFVGERAGSGRFDATALASYVGGTLTYTAPGTGAVTRSINSKLADVLSVKDYGALGDGVADDTVHIQAAMDAGAAIGGAQVMFPIGNYKISASLNIGNGTASAVSTKAGVVLVGEGAAAITGFFPGFALNPSVRITWAGSAAPMINVNGPIQGWGVQNLALIGGSIATVGLNVTSAQFGDCRDLLISGCMTQGIGSTTVAPFGALTNTDSLHNSWRNIAISCPVSANVKGVVLTGFGGAAASNTCYNEFTNLFIGLPASGAGYALYLQNCDSNKFHNIHIAGGSAAATGILLDYTSVPGQIWPSANSFFGIDTNGAVLGVNQYVNSGTPSQNARPNYIVGLDEDNSGIGSNVANLFPSRPTVMTPCVYLENQSAALAGAVLVDPYASGIYRVALYLATMATGNAVTVTASIGWNDGTAKTFTTQPINLSTGANNPQYISLPLVALANFGITYSTSVSGALGTGLYRLAIVAERLF
jgi:hypothetical protein